MRLYYVYIMTNRHRSTLYTGLTNSLEHRILQHKSKSIEGFTSRYHLDRLVYYEETDDIGAAIGREKQIKGWTRAKKVALIESMNPHWQDLAEGWYEERRSVGPLPGAAPSPPPPDSFATLPGADRGCGRRSE
jgi:putative endonuclease